MRTAVIYSGAMRSFAKCLPTHHWHAWRHLGEVDFFVSTYKDGTEGQAELLRTRYPQSRVEIEVVAEQPDCIAEMRAKGVSLPERWVKGQPYTHEPHAISVHPQAVLRQLWQLQKGWELMQRTTPMEDYELVIRCRPDLWFHTCEEVVEVRRGLHWGHQIARTPWWGRFGGGVNDRFAMLGQSAAKAYFRAYDVTPELLAKGCPLHPETIIGAALANQDSVLWNIRAEFSTMRADGTMRPPEISMSDIAHLASSR